MLYLCDCSYKYDIENEGTDNKTVKAKITI